MYGYAIAKRAAAASDNQLRLTPGVLYPLLASLEKQGLISANWEIRSDRAASPEIEGGAEAEGGGRRRKWYSLSPKGERHLRIAAAGRVAAPSSGSFRRGSVERERGGRGNQFAHLAGKAAGGDAHGMAGGTGGLAAPPL